LARLLVTAVFLVAAAACATSGPVDDSPEVDPNIPGLEAGTTPQPVEGGRPDGTTTPPTTPPGTPPPPPPPVGPPPPPPPPSDPKPAAGEVIITEVMFNPSTTEPDTEWFELYNTASATRTLTGLTLVDSGGRTANVGGSVTIGAGKYVVFARLKASATTAGVPAAAIVYEYGAGVASAGGILLTNGTTGSIAVKDGATAIAQVTYGGFGLTASGASVQLKGPLTAAAESVKADWCQSANAFAVGKDKGTPGAASDCP
jgi:hypothetical protein